MTRCSIAVRQSIYRVNTQRAVVMMMMMMMKYREVPRVDGFLKRLSDGQAKPHDNGLSDEISLGQAAR